MSKPNADILTGDWSYRAFKNATDLTLPFNDLRFATATLSLDGLGENRITGTLTGEGWGTWIAWSLNLSGRYSKDDAIALQGENEIQGERWIYEYQGALLPEWPDGKDKRFVLTGSVIRRLARDNLPGEAGEHATFIAIKRDHSPD